MPIALLSETFRRFFRSESSGGLLLLTAAIAAIVIANSPLGPTYTELLHTPIGLRSSHFDLRLSISHWVNDGLMVLFFLLVGLELKREVLRGELASRATRTLPLAAAIGGMVVPALLYLLVITRLGGSPRGWAIPTATDIAFSLAMVKLLGDRVPPALAVFLTALAIVDDLGAILVIALFYTAQISLPSLGAAFIFLAALFILNRRGVQVLAPYLFLGIFLWVAILASGVHATIAGVLLALTIPLHRQTTAESNTNSCPLHRLEHALHTPVAFVILPLFALTNSGIQLDQLSRDVLCDGLTLGIALGLAVGKPIGVLFSSWLAVRVGGGALPQGAGWSHMLGVAFLTGIGFTMSLFIGALAFPDGSADTHVRVGVIGGSILAAGMGLLCLSRCRPLRRSSR